MLDQIDRRAIDERQIINRHDLDLVNSITDAEQREIIVCSIISHRRPDTLAVGDPVPALDLAYLEPTETMKTVNLALISDRPLVLFFGSYT